MPEPVVLRLDAKTADFVKGIGAAADALRRLARIAEDVSVKLGASLKTINGSISSLKTTMGGISSASKSMQRSLDGIERGLSGVQAPAKAASTAFHATATAATQAAAQIQAANATISASRPVLGGQRVATTAAVRGATGGGGGASAGGGGAIAAAAAGAAGAAGIAAAAGSVAAVTKVLDKGISDLGASILNLRNLFIAMGAIGGITKIVQTASEFGKALAYVDTLLVDSAVSVGRYEGQLKELAGRSSKDLTDLTRGLYQTISSGIPAIEGAAGAFAVLEQAEKAAVAGMATTESSVRVIAGTMNAYAETGLTAAEASDILFQTVNRGVVEFPQLAESLGQVTSVAAAVGVSLPEVGAAVATMTKRGLPAESAIRGFRQALVSIIRPPEEAKRALKALGLEFGAVQLQEKGFVGVLDEIVKKTHGSAQAIGELFNDVDGAKSILALASAGGKTFKADLRGIGDAAGATQTAYEKMSQTFDFATGVLKNKISITFVEIGKTILPQLQKAFVEFGDYLTKNQEGLAESVGKFVSALISIGTFVVTHGPTILEFFATLFVATKIGQTTAAIWEFNAAIKAAGVASAAASAAAGAAGGVGMVGGFAGGLKGIGGVIATFLKSPGLLALGAASALIGYKAGTYLAEAYGEAMEAEGNARILKRVEALGEAIASRFEAIGVKTKKQFDELRDRLGQAFDVGAPEGAAGESLAQVAARKGNTGAELNKRLDSLAAAEKAAQAGMASTAGKLIDAAANVEALRRSQAKRLDDSGAVIDTPEVTAAEDRVAQLQQSLVVGAKSIEDFAAGRVYLVQQYSEVTKDAVDKAKEAALALKAGKRAEDAARRPHGSKDGEGSDSQKSRLAAEAAWRLALEETYKMRIANAKSALDAEEAAAEARLKLGLEVAEADAATEWQLLKIREDAFAATETLYKSRVALVKEAAEAEIGIAVHAETTKLEKLRLTKGGPELIDKRTAEVRRTIELKTNAELVALAQARAATLGALEVQHTKNYLEEVSKRRAVFEKDSDARIEAAQEAGASEIELANLRVQRAKELGDFVNGQTGALRAEARIRINDARTAAQTEINDAKADAAKQIAIAEELAKRLREIKSSLTWDPAVEQAAAGEASRQRELALGSAQASAAKQIEIEQELAKRIATIKANFHVEAGELDKAQTDDEAKAGRVATRARAAQRVKDQEEINAERAARPSRADAFEQLATPEGIGGALKKFGFGAVTNEASGLGDVLMGGAATGAAGAIAVLPAISAGLKSIGGMFGGDVEGIRKKARSKEAEADKIEKQLAAFDKSAVARREEADQKRTEAERLSLEADALRSKDPKSQEAKDLIRRAKELRAEASVLSRGATPEEKAALQERLAALRAESEELRNAADAAKGGLETFFEDFFKNAEAALTGLLIGLPQAVDRILGVALPAFIKKLIGHLPMIIAGLVELLPSLVWDFAKAINYVLPIALYDGFVQAGRAIANFILEALTGDTKVVTPLDAKATGAALALGGGILAPTGAVAYAGYKAYKWIDANLHHEGGTIRSAGRDISGALAFAAGGAPHFAFGGMVQAPGTFARAQLGRVLAGDDVPAILQAGEGVLSRAGMRAAGGEQALAALNRGQQPAGFSGPLQANVNIIGGEVTPILRMLLSAVAIDIGTGNGVVRRAVQQRVSRAPLMVRAVRGRS